MIKSCRTIFGISPSRWTQKNDDSHSPEKAAVCWMFEVRLFSLSMTWPEDSQTKPSNGKNSQEGNLVGVNGIKFIKQLAFCRALRSWSPGQFLLHGGRNWFPNEHPPKMPGLTWITGNGHLICIARDVTSWSRAKHCVRMCWVALALGRCRDSPALQGENHWYVRVSLFVPEGYPSGHLPTGDPMVDKMQYVALFWLVKAVLITHVTQVIFPLYSSYSINISTARKCYLVAVG